jgi:hypothetical protein
VEKQPKVKSLDEKRQKQLNRIDVQRILTPKDFERIEQLKQEMAEMKKNPKMRAQKRQRAESDSDSDEEEFSISGGGITPGVVVKPEDLEGWSKKRRSTVEDRLKSVLEGRDKWVHNGKSGGGSTNKEKERKKNYTMVRTLPTIHLRFDPSLHRHVSSLLSFSPQMRVKKVKMDALNIAGKCEAQLKRERNKKLKGVSKRLKKKRRKF